MGDGAEGGEEKEGEGWRAVREGERASLKGGMRAF